MGVRINCCQISFTPPIDVQVSSHHAWLSDTLQEVAENRKIVQFDLSFGRVGIRSFQSCLTRQLDVIVCIQSDAAGRNIGEPVFNL